MNPTSTGTRWWTSRFLWVGGALAGAGYLPLQLCILFGPRDGNPIGLGLWAVLAILGGLVVWALGFLNLALRAFRGRRG